MKAAISREYQSINECLDPEFRQAFRFGYAPGTACSRPRFRSAGAGGRVWPVDVEAQPLASFGLAKLTIGESVRRFDRIGEGMLKNVPARDWTLSAGEHYGAVGKLAFATSIGLASASASSVATRWPLLRGYSHGEGRITPFRALWKSDYQTTDDQIEELSPT